MLLTETGPMLLFWQLPEMPVMVPDPVFVKTAMDAGPDRVPLVNVNVPWIAIAVRVSVAVKVPALVTTLAEPVKVPAEMGR